MSPEISLVITNFNRASTIERAIRSCLAQLILNVPIELIVVDDGSTDESLRKLNQFSNDIKLISLPENHGVGFASATGLSEVAGEYFMRVDSDDYLSNMACAFHRAILNANKQLSFSYGDIVEVDEHGRKHRIVSTKERTELYRYGAGVMFRTECVRAVGGYDPSFQNAEDYDLLLRLEKNGCQGFHTPIPLYRYFKHSNNLTGKENRNHYWKLAERRNDV